MSEFERKRPRGGDCVTPEEAIQNTVTALATEQSRHEEQTRRIQQEYDEKVRRLESPALQRKATGTGPAPSLSVGDLCRGFFNWVGAKIHWKKRDSTPGVTPSEEVCSGSLIDGARSCLIIWNESHIDETRADSLNQAFRKLGFNVEVKANMSERDTLNILNNLADTWCEDKECLVLIFIAEGTLQCMKTGDGREINLEKIVGLFHPYNAFALRENQTKLFFFQCIGENREEQMWKHGEDPPFAPEYDDGFVLRSTHKRFLPTLERFLTKGGEFHEIMSQIACELTEDSTSHETVGFTSTLQREFFIDQK